MDLAAVDLEPAGGRAKGTAGDAVGGEGSERLVPWDWARWAGTIPYEIMTGIGVPGGQALPQRRARRDGHSDSFLAAVRNPATESHPPAGVRRGRPRRAGTPAARPLPIAAPWPRARRRCATACPTTATQKLPVAHDRLAQHPPQQGHGQELEERGVDPGEGHRGRRRSPGPFPRSGGCTVGPRGRGTPRRARGRGRSTGTSSPAPRRGAAPSWPPPRGARGHPRGESRDSQRGQ